MNIEENITRKSDLINNQSLSSYKNFVAQQNHNVFKRFYNFLEKERPARILEIGTGTGGLTRFLDLCAKDLNLDMPLISFEVNSSPWHQEMVDDGIDVRIENIFSEDYSCITDDIIKFIQEDGLTIVLCDGGDKISEFNCISKYLKVGDIIMAHDFAPNKNYFENYMNRKIWNWMEIQDSDIDECCEKQNLVPYKEGEFLSVAWVCKKKDR